MKYSQYRVFIFCSIGFVFQTYASWTENFYRPEKGLEGRHNIEQASYRRPYQRITPEKVEQSHAVQSIKDGKEVRFQQERMQKPFSSYVQAVESSPKFKRVQAVLPEIFPSYTAEFLQKEPFTRSSYTPEQFANQVFNQWSNPEKTENYHNNLYMGMQSLEKALAPDKRGMFEHVDARYQDRIAKNTTIHDYIEYVGQKFPQVPEKLVEMYVYALFNEPDLHVHERVASNGLFGKKINIQEKDSTQHLQLEDVVDLVMPEDRNGDFDQKALKDYQKLYLTMEAIEKIHNRPEYKNYLEFRDTAQPVEKIAKSFKDRLDNAMLYEGNGEIALVSGLEDRANLEKFKQGLEDRQQFVREKTQKTINENLKKNYPAFQALQDAFVKKDFTDEAVFEAAKIQYVHMIQNLFKFAEMYDISQQPFKDIYDLSVQIKENMDKKIVAYRIEQLQRKFAPGLDSSVKDQLQALDTLHSQMKLDRTVPLSENQLEIKKEVDLQQEKIFNTVHTYLTTIEKETLQAEKNAAQRLLQGRTDVFVSEKDILQQALTDIKKEKKMGNMYADVITTQLERKLRIYTTLQEQNAAAVEQLWNSSPDKNKYLFNLLQACKTELQNQDAVHEYAVKALIQEIEALSTAYKTLEQQHNNFAVINQKLEKCIEKSENADVKNILKKYGVMFQDSVRLLEKEYVQKESIAGYQQNIVKPSMLDKVKQENIKDLVKNVQSLEQKIADLKQLEHDKTTLDSYDFDQKLHHEIDEFNKKTQMLLPQNTTIADLITMYEKIYKDLKTEEITVLDNRGINKLRSGLSSMIQGQFTQGLQQTGQGIVQTPEEMAEILRLQVHSALGPFAGLVSEDMKTKINQKIVDYVATFLIISAITSVGTVVGTSQDDHHKKHHISDEAKQKMLQDLQQALAQDITTMVITDITGASADAVATGDMQLIASDAITRKITNALLPEEQSALTSDASSSELTKFLIKYQSLLSEKNESNLYYDYQDDASKKSQDSTTVHRDDNLVTTVAPSQDIVVPAQEKKPFRYPTFEEVFMKEKMLDKTFNNLIIE